MEIGSRELAKKHGLLTYISSSTCNKGHIHPERYVSDYSCVACSSSGIRRVSSTSRRMAIEQGLSIYTGSSSCSHGHQSPIRYVANGMCVLCSDSHHRSDNSLKKSKEYNRNNKSKLNAKCSKRRASQKQSTPKWSNNWLEKLLVEEQYIIAETISVVTGTKYHVDHIIPLQNSIVCGLHCASNLRVIPAYENITKSNKLIEELCQR